MYNVYNKSDVYFKYNLSEDKLTLIGNRNNFLKEIYLMLKDCYKHDRSILPATLPINQNDSNYDYFQGIRPINHIAIKASSALRNILYLDGYYNTIDPRNYVEEAFNHFCKKI